ncbi:MAG: PepSY domain-containing protein [Frateuria sp.]|uniref:PepSY domain-containing protein n=1 Tax=Frateuria sp. TaxID=2211372 RepID=UPI0017E412CB|nr:PepSY domain-containing protein [Frateuria sp.]NUO71683.1 PepSY domain-containing protein [Frateuria sp.]NUR21674.1 PepSY domain-containing protein [Frateuria sp.]
MRRQNLALACALCAGLFLFNLPLAAQSYSGSQSSMGMTEAQVTTKLQAAGYTNVHGVEHEGDHYDADAMKNGKAVHLHVDAKSGAVTLAPHENEQEENEEHEHHRH